MKRKAKIRRNRELPPPDKGEKTAEPANASATPGRISIESVDEHKTGSIESVPQSNPEKGVVGFIEPGGSDAGSAR